jgi:hypothetical protein
MPKTRTNPPGKKVQTPRPLAHQEMPGALKMQRRNHARFEIAVPVTLVRGGRSFEARTVNLSRGGMLLKGMSGLTPGSRYLFHLALDGRPAPLVIEGEVVEGRAQVARIKFSSNQEVAFARLHAFVVDSVIPRLEAAVRADVVDLQHVIELAALYADDGRNDAALALFRHHWTPVGDMRLHEAFVRHLLQRLGTHSQDAALQAQIEEACAAGLVRGTSAVLTAARDLVAELRGQAAEAAARARAAGGSGDWGEDAVRILMQVAGLERRASAADARTTEVHVRVGEVASRLASVELRLARFDDLERRQQASDKVAELRIRDLEAQLLSRDGIISRLEATLAEVKRALGERLTLTELGPEAARALAQSGRIDLDPTRIDVRHLPAVKHAVALPQAPPGDFGREQQTRLLEPPPRGRSSLQGRELAPNRGTDDADDANDPNDPNAPPS